VLGTVRVPIPTELTGQCKRQQVIKYFLVQTELHVIIKMAEALRHTGDLIQMGW
jgi:hypothetical protein